MSSVSIDSINELIAKDLQQVNEAIHQQLNSDVYLINQLGSYIIDNGGKRIRPIITLLAAKALNYKGQKHITAAAFIEFVHTATLLHDDVVDNSALRRGKKTTNVLFGNAASVLVGDYIYTRSFQMMTSIGSLDVLNIMSAATNVIAEGEVQQLINSNDPDVTVEQYLDVIYRKTARLFEAGTHIGAIIAGGNPEQIEALKNYGKYLGTSFQIIDDLLDYSAKSIEILGKNLGDDFDEGKATLPLIHALSHTSSDNKKMIEDGIRNGNSRQLLDKILVIMNECKSLEYTHNTAKLEAQKAINALSILPDSPYKQALENLATISTNREF